MHQGKLVGQIKKYKAALATCLLLLFLIHNLGFFLVLNSIRHEQRSKFSAKISQQDFDSSQLKAAAIPISFPYQHDEKEFTDVNETMELNGTLYHIVKKRYENNMLHIVYVDEQVSKKVKEEFDHWKNKAQNEHPTAPNSTDQNNVLRTLDYQYLLSEFRFDTVNADMTKDLNFCNPSQNVSSVFLGVFTPPPKFMS